MVRNEEFFHPITTDLITWILDDEPVGRKVEIYTNDNKDAYTGTFGGYIEIGDILFLQIFDNKMDKMTFINTKNMISFTIY